jgi:hypothetical protein
LKFNQHVCEKVNLETYQPYLKKGTAKCELINASYIEIQQELFMITWESSFMVVFKLSFIAKNITENKN